MAKRPLKRSVKIVLKARDQRDPLPLFEAIEAAFRPGTIEITVEAEILEVPTHPNEQLETKAREYVAEELDRRNQEVADAPPTPADTTDPLPQKQRRLTVWLTGLVAVGWKITLKVLPVAERLAKIAKDLGV